MPKPLRIVLDFLSYEGTPTNDPQDAIIIKRKVEEADVSEVSRMQVAIPASTVDLIVALPDSTSDYLVIFVDRTISVKLNNSVTAITLKPKIAGTKCPVLFLKADITALTVSNPGTTDAANLDLIAVNI
jgi:hypothetical protein